MNRYFHNTLSAMSATAVMLAAVLTLAVPAHPLAEPARQATVAEASEVAAAPAPRKQIDVQAVQAQANEIEARAERLAAQLEQATTTGETIAHVAAFTAEVATVTALTAVLNELPDAVEAAEIATIKPAPARRAGKHKRSRQSLAMPYFSFASRS